MFFLLQAPGVLQKRNERSPHRHRNVAIASLVVVEMAQESWGPDFWWDVHSTFYLWAYEARAGLRAHVFATVRGTAHYADSKGHRVSCLVRSFGTSVKRPQGEPRSRSREQSSKTTRKRTPISNLPEPAFSVSVPHITCF